MSEKERKVEVTLGFSVDGIRAAAKNASRLEEVALDVPCVNPKKLSIDDKIYGLKIVPIDDNVKSPVPSTLCSVGVVEIHIESLSGVSKQGYIVVNGRIDIPKEMGHTNKIEDVYFEEKEAAREVGIIFLEEEYEKSTKNLEKAAEIRDFLKLQLEEARV